MTMRRNDDSYECSLFLFFMFILFCVWFFIMKRNGKGSTHRTHESLNTRNRYWMNCVRIINCNNENKTKQRNMVAIDCIYWLLVQPHATHSEAVNQPNKNKTHSQLKNISIKEKKKLSEKVQLATTTTPKRWKKPAKWKCHFKNPKKKCVKYSNAMGNGHISQCIFIFFIYFFCMHWCIYFPCQFFKYFRTSILAFLHQMWIYFIIIIESSTGLAGRVFMIPPFFIMSGHLHSFRDRER